MYYRHDDNHDGFDDRPRRRGLNQGPLLYVIPAAPFGADDDPTLPQEDERDPTAVYWFGKRLYLGGNTHVRRLFELLTSNIGYSFPLREVQRAIDGFETSEDVGDCSNEDIKKADARMRKAISRLKERFTEYGLDDHVVIVRDRE